MDEPKKRRPTFKEILTDKRLALMLALGFSAGLPLLLVFSTQSAWLRTVGIDRASIGLMSYVALAYAFKFLWAPIVDGFDAPVLSRLLGRRRGWMMLAQIGIVIGLVGIAFGDPAHSLMWTIVCALFVAFSSATQDIVIDAWRIDAAPSEQQGMMVATYSLGYRFGMLSAGAGALYLADFFSWKVAYLAMSCLMAIGMIACVLSPRIEKAAAPKPESASWNVTLAKSFYEPLADMFQRYGWKLAFILILVTIYRLPDFVSGVMANPLYVDLGFSLSDIATVSKIYGVWIGMIGVFAGGYCVSRLGLMPTLLIGGVAASSSHLMMALLANSGARIEMLTAAISIENFAGSFAGAALIAWMSSLTAPAFAATQYALLSSLYALPGKLVAGVSGFVVNAYGYTTFFISTSLIGIPVALLCLLIWKFNADEKAREERAATAPSPT